MAKATHILWITVIAALLWFGYGLCSVGPLGTVILCFVTGLLGGLVLLRCVGVGLARAGLWCGLALPVVFFLWMLGVSAVITVNVINATEKDVVVYVLDPVLGECRSKLLHAGQEKRFWLCSGEDSDELNRQPTLIYAVDQKGKVWYEQRSAVKDVPDRIVVGGCSGKTSVSQPATSMGSVD